MAQIVIKIPDDKMDRVVNAFCASFDYHEKIQDNSEPGSEMIPNPESKNQFAQRMVRQYVIQVVQGYETRITSEMAADKKRKELATDLDFT